MKGLLRFALAVGLCSAGCGDAMTDGAYPGETLFLISGQVNGALDNKPLIAPKVGIAWVTGNAGEGRVPGQIAPVSAERFPAQFELRLFEPPPPSAFGWLFGERQPQTDVAAGLIYAIDDQNQDGKFDVSSLLEPTDISAPDKLFGIAKGVWLYYVKPGATLQGEDDLSAAPGYHLARADCGSEAKLIQLADELVDVTTFPPADRFPAGLDSGHACHNVGPDDDVPDDDEVASPPVESAENEAIFQPCRTGSKFFALKGNAADLPVDLTTSSPNGGWSQSATSGSKLKVHSPDLPGLDLNLSWASKIARGEEGEINGGSIVLPNDAGTFCPGAMSRVLFSADGILGFELSSLKGGADCAEAVAGQFRGCWTNGR